MPKNTRITLCLLPLLLFSHFLKAQLKLGFNGELLVPVATLSNYFSSGIGAGATVKYVSDGTFGVFAQANYNLLSRAGGSAAGETNTLFNYSAGVEYYINKQGNGVFLSAEIGNYVVSSHVSASATGLYSGGSSNSAWGMAPGLGYEYSFSDRTSVYGLLKYNYTFSSLYTGIANSSQFLQANVGVIFNFGSKQSAKPADPEINEE